MDSMAFDQLLCGTLSTRLRWSRARRCACLESGGGAVVGCGVCGGEGFVWEEWSDTFQAGLLGLTGKHLQALVQRYGPGFVGDAALSLPSSSPAYQLVSFRDRFVELDATDTFEWVVPPNYSMRLPIGGVVLEARAKSNDGLALLNVPPPSPDETRAFQVTVPTVLTIRAPRVFEVVEDASQVRSWQSGLPRKLALKRIDQSVRW